MAYNASASMPFRAPSRLEPIASAANEPDSDRASSSEGVVNRAPPTGCSLPVSRHCPPLPGRALLHSQQ